MAGKGISVTQRKCVKAVSVLQKEKISAGNELEVVMSHDRLLSAIKEAEENALANDELFPLKAFEDKTTGLWGLKKGGKMVSKAQYRKVMDIRGSFAAVRLSNRHLGVVNAHTFEVLKLDGCKDIQLLPGNLLQVTHKGNSRAYVDLLNNQWYPACPKVIDCEGMELLMVNHRYYSRTKKLYMAPFGMTRKAIVRKDFYLELNEYGVPSFCRQIHEDESHAYSRRCLLDGDKECVYFLCGTLPDKSLVVMNADGQYYHVEKGKGKRYIACNQPQAEDENFDVAIPRLLEEMTRNGRHDLSPKEKENRLPKIKEAKPYHIGLKWGLKTADRIIVPPIYRHILSPVGGYCAYEEHPRQWGVLRLDGSVIIEARYMEVNIANGGTVRLTVVPGRTKTVNLPPLRWESTS